MDYIKITEENLDKEHICCAISNNKDPQVASKKNWMRERMKDGLVFLKGDIRGKCFIEYIPAENAWVPVDAEGYMHINCFWVSGSCKGHGYGDELLEACINDAKEKGKIGLTVISSLKKKPFLSDPGYLGHKGFQIADTADPHYSLLYLPFSGKEDRPKFKECAKKPSVKQPGFVLYYTYGCPYTAKYVPILEQYVKTKNIPFKSIFIDSPEEAQNTPVAWTNYALFYNGKYITNEILNEKKFDVLYKRLIEQGKLKKES